MGSNPIPLSEALLPEVLSRRLRAKRLMIVWH